MFTTKYTDTIYTDWHLSYAPADKSAPIRLTIGTAQPTTEVRSHCRSLPELITALEISGPAIWRKYTILRHPERIHLFNCAPNRTDPCHRSIAVSKLLDMAKDLLAQYEASLEPPPAPLYDACIPGIWIISSGHPKLPLNGNRITRKALTDYIRSDPAHSGLIQHLGPNNLPDYCFCNSTEKSFSTGDFFPSDTIFRVIEDADDD